MDDMGLMLFLVLLVAAPMMVLGSDADAQEDDSSVPDPLPQPDPMSDVPATP